MLSRCFIWRAVAIKSTKVNAYVKNPKINGDGGGDVAAPIFSEIIETIQKL